MMLYDILLDVGGTGIKGGYFSVAGETISPPQNFISNSSQSKAIILEHFSGICGEIWDSIADGRKQIRSIRMAFPGPFDYQKGISQVKGLAKYESLFGVSIPKEMIGLAEKRGYSFLPREERGFRFVNDVEAYALGAMDKRRLWNGKRVLYLCIGTGAGSAYSVDGNLVTEKEPGVPQNGWIFPVRFLDSIIDDYISARGISRLAEKYYGKKLSPLELSLLAKSGDETGGRAYKEFGENLKAALLPLLEKFMANTLVIGGNISRSSQLFLGPTEEACEKRGIEMIIESNTSELAMRGLTLL